MKSGLVENSMVPVFVVGRDLHLHYPLESLPSALLRDRQHLTSHKNKIHHIRAGDHQACCDCGLSLVMEVREIIMMRPGQEEEGW